METEKIASPVVVKKHLCELCGAAFQFPSGLVTHTKGKHEKQRPFNCKVEGCDKAFLFAVGLRTHMLKHEGLKPFACVVCGKSFRQKGQMMLHAVTAHTPEKEEKKARAIEASSCQCCKEMASLLKKHMAKD